MGESSDGWLVAGDFYECIYAASILHAVASRFHSFVTMQLQTRESTLAVEQPSRTLYGAVQTGHSSEGLHTDLIPLIDIHPTPLPSPCLLLLHIPPRPPPPPFPASPLQPPRGWPCALGCPSATPDSEPPRRGRCVSTSGVGNDGMRKWLQ